MWLGVGSVAMAALPAGPAGQTLACVKCGLYLASNGDTRLALLLRGPSDSDPDSDTTLEVACADQVPAGPLADVGNAYPRVYRGEHKLAGHRVGRPCRITSRPAACGIKWVKPSIATVSPSCTAPAIASGSDTIRATPVPASSLAS